MIIFGLCVFLGLGEFSKVFEYSEEKVYVFNSRCGVVLVSFRLRFRFECCFRVLGCGLGGSWDCGRNIFLYIFERG